MDLVEAAFGSSAPVGRDDAALALEYPAGIEEGGWNVGLQRRHRGIGVTDEDEHYAEGLLNRVDLDATLADQLAVRCADDVAQHPVFPAVGEAVVPAADGAFRVALGFL